MAVDIVVKGGRLVDARGVVEGGVAIDDGAIVAVAKETNLPKGDVVFDAEGKIVLPGVMDSHTHLSCAPEDARIGTMAAAHGGVTTVLDMPSPGPNVFTSEQFREKLKTYRGKCFVDFSLHGGYAPALPEGSLSEVWRLGATGIKFFMAPPAGWPPASDGEILEGLRELASVHGLALVHAENDQILRHNLTRLKAAGRIDYAAHLEARPPIAEAEAGRRIMLYLKETGARGLILHTSLPETVWSAREAVLQGAAVHIETCPQYLYMTEEDVKERGPWIKFAPPARDKGRVTEMWRLLREGFIDTVASDHGALSKESKAVGLDDMLEARNGIPGLETLLPLMLTAVNDGLLGIERLAAVLSENPARIFGLYPRKGSFLPGADGDLVVVDMKTRRRIRSDDLITACGWTPYEGLEVRGLPVFSTIRGNIVLDHGDVVGNEGLGVFLPRGAGARNPNRG